jgi:hypothetical protein
MSRDHVEASRLTEQPRIVRSRIFQPDFDRVTATELRRVLYSLYSLVKLHFAKEEGFIYPYWRTTSAKATPTNFSRKSPQSPTKRIMRSRASSIELLPPRKYANQIHVEQYTSALFGGPKPVALTYRGDEQGGHQAGNGSRENVGAVCQFIGSIVSQRCKSSRQNVVELRIASSFGIFRVLDKLRVRV